LVGNTWCIDEQYLVETVAAHSKTSKELFRMHTQVFNITCAAALSVIFDLQVDVAETSFFVLP
jgi:hypothetical protein